MDSQKLLERVEILEATCQELMAAMKLNPPSPTTTRVCPRGESHDIEN